MHVPGIKVVMPSTPYDAKGLLIAAVNDGNPVMYIDDRWLYEERGDVPEAMYTVEPGTAALRRAGSDVTIVATSYMAVQAARAASTLADEGVDAELIDLRSIKPWDQTMVCSSVRRTGCLVIADASWVTGGIAAEIAATVAYRAFDRLQAPVERVCLPDAPAPSSPRLESAYFIGADDIVLAVRKVLRSKKEKEWRTLVPSLTRRSTTAA